MSRTAIPGAVALAQDLARRVRALEVSERLPADELRRIQFAALARLAAFAAQQSPHFARRLAAAGLAPADLAGPEGLAALPPLQRRGLQGATDLFSRGVPPAHHPISKTQTSGSTGEPVTVFRTRINQLDWLAITMRDHAWHEADFSRPFVAVRANVFSVARAADWGAPAGLLRHTGPSLALPITMGAEEMLDILCAFRPGTLLIYPGSLAALVEHAAAQGRQIDGLERISTIGETLSPGLRARALQVLGAAVTDLYSAQEVGYIALQCPRSGLYHVMAETMIVEVLDGEGRACRPGQTGRVVLTDLRNLATPLVRYAIGDHAEVGGVCSCGRSLPTLKRILGRERNLIAMPDGTRHWPLVGFHRFRELAPVVQYQLIQRSLEEVEVRLVVARPLTEGEEEALGTHIQASLGHPFALTFAYFECRLPVSGSGKFEEFVCLV
jgi:phenylacetate-CoA ligase